MLEFLVLRDLLSRVFDARKRVPISRLPGEDACHERSKLGFAPDPADRQAGGARKEEARTGEPAIAGSDTMTAKVGEQFALLPVVCQREHGSEVFADLAVDPGECLIFRTVGGEFERQVCTLAVLRLERMKAGEMRAMLSVFVPAERCTDVASRGISQNIDGGFCV